MTHKRRSRSFEDTKLLSDHVAGPFYAHIKRLRAPPPSPVDDTLWSRMRASLQASMHAFFIERFSSCPFTADIRCVACGKENTLEFTFTDLARVTPLTYKNVCACGFELTSADIKSVLRVMYVEALDQMDSSDSDTSDSDASDSSESEKESLL